MRLELPPGITPEQQKLMANAEDYQNIVAPKTPESLMYKDSSGITAIQNDAPASLPKQPITSQSTSAPKQLILPPGISAISTTKEEPEEGIGQKIMSYMSAAGRGIYHGLDTIATTLDKAIAKGLGDEATVAALQSTYEENTRDYNTNVDTNKHPWVAGVGNIIGNLIATAPLAYAGGSAVGGLFGGALADAGAGAAAQAVGRGAGALLGNTAQGGVMGGLMTKPGQGMDVWNSEGARQGAIAGAVLTPVQGAIGASIGNATKYGKYADSLKKVGYNGPVFSTDVPENQGMWNSIKQGLVNNVVSKIPVINNVPGVGATSARLAQQKGITSAVSNYVQGIADKYPNGNLATFTKAIQNSKALADQSISNSSQTFRSALKDAGIMSHELTNSQPIIQDLMQNDKAVLNNNFKNILQKTGDTISTDALLGSKQTAGLKQQVWNEYERLSQDRMNTPAYDASQKLKDLYHSINTDIEQSASGSPKALQAFHSFNTITNGVKTLWDPQNSPEIAKAVLNLNTSQKGLMSFWKSMQNQSLSPQTQTKYAQMLGQEGTDAAQDQALQSIFSKNLDPTTGRFNISGFFKGIDNPNININPQTKSALYGLQFLAQKNSQALQAQGAKEGAANIAAKAGAIGGIGYMLPGARAIMGGVLASGAALGALTAHPILKQTLNMLDKVGTIDNQGLATYILNKANNQLIRAGVIMQHDQEGNTNIITKGEQ